MSANSDNSTTLPFTESGTADADSDKAIRKDRKRANALDGKTWTRNSISIWSDIRKTSEEISLRHPAMFPIALAERLISCYAKPNANLILDLFAGVGSTVLAAQNLGMSGIGIELSPDFASIARRRVNSTTLFEDQLEKGAGEIYVANAIKLLDFVAEDTIDLVVTSPPYWDILNEKRSADLKESRHYGNLPGDLGTISDYREFIQGLNAIFQRVKNAMRPGGYCCVVVMDIRKKDQFFSYHSDLATSLQEIGFIFDDIIIWDRRHEYNNLRPLGFPSVFRVNKVHEFILIFKKPND